MVSGYGQPERMDWNGAYEKDALKSWGFSYAPNQVTEWQYHYSTMFRQWMDQAFRYMPQDLEERLNMQYMEAAQNPDMDKYRIPQGTAKQMLLYDEAPVYRLLPSGSEKIAPIAASLRACGMKITGSLPLHRGFRRSGQTDPQGN